ncbi:hypothetical protein Dsin_011494 [Dipteronia sinensis]|uniref:C2H2-type domain-containing protein n=1 Tax=Dipteronia sinensis TaxID=43782 RepID=A0AAE0EDV3_9ROSI|nr:hypothetical protein Dsin_011494 [Dipteronia sinensis]
MMKSNDNNNSKEAPTEENLQDVSSEQEDMPITTSPVSSPSSAPVAADDQASEKGTSSSTTPQKKPKQKSHLTSQQEQEYTPPNMADYQGGNKVPEKRGKRPVEGTSLSMPKRKKQQKKKELDLLGVVPSSPPRCYICKKLFKTWKAVFGHMRIHNKVEEVRESGEFPSPDFTPPSGASSEEEIDSNLEDLNPVLLNIAQQVILETTRPDGLIIDLNQPGPSSPNQEESTRPFDLNEPPPPEEEDEEKDHIDDQNIDGGGDDAAN